jgi:class 3 adenylate cyclase
VDDRGALEAERRQLSVLFCDLVDSTVMAAQLDPEDYRTIVRAYQAACGAEITRFAGHIAQYLGDGLLVYFGHPHAHEDDAQRAVRAALGMVEAVARLNPRLERERGVQLAVRVGIHTGLVVAGEIGADGRHEQLALGATPNVAARLQGLAAANTVVVSAATYRLITGYFACRELGFHTLRGLAQPTATYQVLQESGARSRLDVAAARGFTPLAGRAAEVGLLRERWAQAQAGIGQVVLLSGEAGIGKSRLVRVVAEQVAQDPQAWLTPLQCSPYHQHSAFYPLIAMLERVALQFAADDAAEAKRGKLEGWLVQYGLELSEAVPLFAGLLSVPLGEGYTPLSLSPEQQKQRTMDVVVRILLEHVARQPLLLVVEDLHWADPSTQALLDLIVAQVPTARILALFTARPEYLAPWGARAHLLQLTLHRLPLGPATDIVTWVAGGKSLPALVRDQILTRSDGVPLFAEELTKTVLESGLLQEEDSQYTLSGPLPPLAIPATLQDSLMARLDRLATVKDVAQLAAALGREFAYDVLQAVSSLDEATLQQALATLVDAELLYQRGLPPRAQYIFKHALIQEAAYQSLLKSRRQQVHRQIAQVLVARFPQTLAAQPEVVAQHYTEAGLVEEALPYWQRAGQQAAERSAYLEAISHLTRGLALLQTLPDSPARAPQELALQVALGQALLVLRGNTAPEVEQAYSRARELCRQVGASAPLVPVLRGLWQLYVMRGASQTAQELAGEVLAAAEGQDDEQLLLAHYICGNTRLWLGELAAARAHLEESLARYETWDDPQRNPSPMLTH